MARGRMISYSVSTDKRFNALSTQAALVFLMTVPHLDRDGLILADACIIAGQICPRREEITSLVADAILQEWIEQGMVIAYEGNDGTILFFTGFSKNQAGMRYDREPKSILPVPPGYKRTEDGLEPLPMEPPAPPTPPTNGSEPPNDGKLPAHRRHNDGDLPPERTRAEVEVEGKGREKEGEVEGKGNGAREAQPAQPAPLDMLPVRLQSRNGSGSERYFQSPHIDKTHFDPVTGYVLPGKGTTAVEVYYERFDICHNDERLTSPMEDDLVLNCPDLELLRDVVTAYSRAGYRTMRNMKLILDWYREPERYQGKPSMSVLPGGNGRASPVDKTQAEADKLRAVFKSQGKESLLHG